MRNPSDGFLDRRDHACRQKRAVGGIRLSLRAESLNKHKFALGWGLKHVVSLGGIFFTHQDFETKPAPCEMVAHAASSVGLNHRVNAGGFERTFGKIGFDLRGETVNDREFATIHDFIIRPEGDCGSGRKAKGSLRVLPRELRCDFAKSRRLKV